MFSGIVECTSSVKSVTVESDMLRMKVDKPSHFDDLAIGDSVAVNGVCLTVEKFDETEMEFVAASETLKITGWTAQAISKSVVNLERSLRYGDRVHGHLVSGHVDTRSEVLDRKELEGSLFLEVSVPESLRPFIWKKGSVALNGVSLTVNEVTECGLSVLLIPETLRRSNLKSLGLGDLVNIEGDYYAKGLAAMSGIEKKGRPSWSN